MEPQVARSNLEAERDRLEKTKGVIEGEGISDESEEESMSELSHADQHPADTGTEAFEREKELSILEEIEDELQDVEHALHRLDEGSYGTCEICREPIADERLEARPAARFCVEHQRAAEGGRLI